MTKEKLKFVKKCAITVGLIVGLVILGVSMVASIVGIILSLCDVCDLLDASVSVFVAATSSFLTLFSLILTVKSSKDAIEAQNKMIQLQSETIELQRAEKESRTVSTINQIQNSLYLETIEIDKSLIPKTITHHNPCAKEGVHNLRMGLLFSAENINELQEVALKKLGLYFACKSSNQDNLRIYLKEENTTFSPIQSKGNNVFLYEIITNVSDDVYQRIIHTLETIKACGLVVDIRLALKTIDGFEIVWARSKPNRLNFHFAEFDKKKLKYYFKTSA